MDFQLKKQMGFVTQKFNKYWSATFTLLLILGLFLWAILSLKLNGYNHWLFSSDFFTFDQLLNETLKGNFGVEYTYGNQFGDHAYLVLLLMLPIKLLLGQYFVEFLLFLSPIVFVLTCFFVFRLSLKRLQSPFECLLIAIAFLFSFRIFEALSPCVRIVVASS